MARNPETHHGESEIRIRCRTCTSQLTLLGRSLFIAGACTFILRYPLSPASLVLSLRYRSPSISLNSVDLFLGQRSFLCLDVDICAAVHHITGFPRNLPVQSMGHRDGLSARFLLSFVIVIVREELFLGFSEVPKNKRPDRNLE